MRKVRLTWLDTGLCLRPGLLSSSSSCLRLKLETPRDFTSPASLQASNACWREKNHTLTRADSDYLYRDGGERDKRSTREDTGPWSIRNCHGQLYVLDSFWCYQPTNQSEQMVRFPFIFYNCLCCLYIPHPQVKANSCWNHAGSLKVRTNLPCCTEVCVVVDIFPIFVFWIEFFPRLEMKRNGLNFNSFYLYIYI